MTLNVKFASLLCLAKVPRKFFSGTCLEENCAAEIRDEKGCLSHNATL